jgi:hypothetical protein
LDLGVEQAQVAGSSHPVARLKVENAAAIPIAFSRTFGITNQPWLSFELQTLRGEVVSYPSEIDVFSETPAYMCLQPGEWIEWQIDLLSWRPTFGGEVSEEEYAFDLPPGRYRIRARYSDDPGRVRARCQGIKGTSTSEWVEFEVKD